MCVFASVFVCVCAFAVGLFEIFWALNFAHLNEVVTQMRLTRFDGSDPTGHVVVGDICVVHGCVCVCVCVERGCRRCIW